MSDNKKQETNGFENLQKFVQGLGLLCWRYGQYINRGCRYINFKKPEVYLVFLFWLIISCLMVKFNFFHLRCFDGFFSIFGAGKIFFYFSYLGIWANVVFLGFFIPSFFVFGLGLADKAKAKKYQSAIESLNIKTPLKKSPEVIDLTVIDDDRKVLHVLCSGIPPDKWLEKKSGLEFAFKATIDEIKASNKKDVIKIQISESPLPSLIPFSKFEEMDLEPFHFIVGESKKELITESIMDCPHVLMGGSTGMGKSTSFKLMIYSLLKGTPEEQISFSLLDLKGGVEVVEFKDFSNVEISKNEVEAVESLKTIKEEMTRRYAELEESENKKIDPVRDKKPLIIVAVDEASVIFGAKGRSSSKKKLADEARELCEDIAKLGRAAGIHLILATQRATKNSIDTATLDNLEARLCFRTQSVSGSTALLGNNSGTLLPDIAGRGIWRKGTTLEKLQVPYISEKDFKKKCEELKEERKADENEEESAIEESVKASHLLERVDSSDAEDS